MYQVGGNGRREVTRSGTPVRCPPRSSRWPIHLVLSLSLPPPIVSHYISPPLCLILPLLVSAVSFRPTVPWSSLLLASARADLFLLRQPGAASSLFLVPARRPRPPPAHTPFHLRPSRLDRFVPPRPTALFFSFILPSSLDLSLRRAFSLSFGLPALPSPSRLQLLSRLLSQTDSLSRFPRAAAESLPAIHHFIFLRLGVPSSRVSRFSAPPWAAVLQPTWREIRHVVLMASILEQRTLTRGVVLLRVPRRHVASERRADMQHALGRSDPRTASARFHAGTRHE